MLSLTRVLSMLGLVLWFGAVPSQSSAEYFELFSHRHWEVALLTADNANESDFCVAMVNGQDRSSFRVVYSNKSGVAITLIDPSATGDTTWREKSTYGSIAEVLGNLSLWHEQI